MLLSTLCYSLWLSFSRIGKPTRWPLIWLLFNTIILCNPLPVHYRSSRMWLIKRFAKLMITGLERVEVRGQLVLLGVAWTHRVALSSLSSGWGEFALLTDLLLLTLTSWFGHPHRDQICSLNFSLTNLFFVGCVYTSGFQADWNTKCSSHGSYWMAYVVLAVLPFLCRFIQSVRRWYDSRLMTHLVNVSNSAPRGKDSTDTSFIGRKVQHRHANVCVLLLLEIYRKFRGGGLRALHSCCYCLLCICLCLGACCVRICFLVQFEHHAGLLNGLVCFKGPCQVPPAS